MAQLSVVPAADTLTFCDLGRDGAKACASLKRYRADHPCDCVGDADMVPRLARSGIASRENLEGKTDEVGRTSCGVGFESGQADRRFILEIALPRIDQPIDELAGQGIFADRRGQRLGHRMTADGAGLIRRRDILAPPFETDPAERRLGHALTYPCILVVEGVKRE